MTDDLLRERVAKLEQQVRYLLKVIWATEATSHAAYRYEQDYFQLTEDEE